MSAEVTQALTRAFFDEWISVGYCGISLERVARSAGVGKAALYRRWRDKVEMASSLLADVGLDITAPVDCGSFAADLMAQLLAIRRVLRHAGIRRIVVDLHAEVDRIPALAAAIRPFQTARRAKLNAVIDRAIARGELAPTIDRELLIDFVAAQLYWRMVILGGRMTRQQVARLSQAIQGAMGACPAATTG